MLYLFCLEFADRANNVSCAEYIVELQFVLEGKFYNMRTYTCCFQLIGGVMSLKANSECPIQLEWLNDLKIYEVQPFGEIVVLLQKPTYSNVNKTQIEM